MLVEFTLLVVGVGSTELVDTIVDDGSIVDLIVSSVTVEIYKSSIYASIRYESTHTVFIHIKAGLIYMQGLKCMLDSAAE